MLKRFHAVAGLAAIALGLQFGLDATSFAGGHGDCDCSHWYFWKNPKGPFGRDQICDTPCGTPFSCPPQGGYFGYFPTCWSRWPQDWQNCPVTDAPPSGMAPCNMAPTEILPEAIYENTDPNSTPDVAEPPLVAPPAVAPSPKSPPSSSRRTRGRTAAASGRQLDSPANIAPANVRGTLVSGNIVNAPSDRVTGIDDEEPEHFIPAEKLNHSNELRAARPIRNQRAPIRWEALEATVAAEAEAREVVQQRLPSIQKRETTASSDVELALRRNPVRTRTVDAKAGQHAALKQPSSSNVKSRAVITVQAKVPVRADHHNPLRGAPMYEIGDLRNSGLRNPLRR